MRIYFSCRNGGLSGSGKDDATCTDNANKMHAILPFLPAFTPTLKDNLARFGLSGNEGRVQEALKQFFNENQAKMVEKVGSSLHDGWRAPRLLTLEDAKAKLASLDPSSDDYKYLKAAFDKSPNGPIYQPRFKNGMDIANTAYPDLNAPGKGSNEVAAQHIVDTYKNNLLSANPKSELDI